MKLGTGLRVGAVVAWAASAVLANVLVHRHFVRWDLSKSKLYSLAPSTQKTLLTIQHEHRAITVYVFMSLGDSLLPSVRQMLESYRAVAGTTLTYKILDPDRERAEYLQLAATLGLRSGKSEGGKIVSDAQIVVESGDRHWYVQSDRLVSPVDGDSTHTRSMLEAELTSSLLSVLSTERTHVCFTSKSGEASLEDSRREGLSILKNILEKNNYVVEAFDHTESCSVIAVIAPQFPMIESDVIALEQASKLGKPLLFAVPPAIDMDQKKLRPHGLDRLAAAAGVGLPNALAIETDPSLREPNSSGLAFTVHVASHESQNDLIRVLSDHSHDAMVNIDLARPLARIGSQPIPLLISESSTFGLRDITGLLSSHAEPTPSHDDLHGPLDLAVVTHVEGSKQIWSGTASPWVNATFGDESPQALALRTLGLMWISYLADRPALVDLPPRPSQQVRLHLTDGELSTLSWYVFLYLPAATLMLAAAVTLMRNRRPTRA